MKRLALIVSLAALLGCGDDSSAPDASMDGAQDVSIDDVGVDASADAGFDDVGAPDAAGDAGMDVGGDAGVDGGSDAGVDVEALIARIEMDAAAVDAEVESAGGWPVIQGERVLFMTEWDTDDAVSWVGTSNDFTPDLAIATRVGPYVYALVDGAAGKYKWHAAGEFRAPPEARRYGYDEFGEHGWVRAPDAEHFERYRFARHTVRAWLSGAPMDRVLIVHDGQNLFDPDAPFGGWRMQDALRESHADTLVIGVDNTPQRFQEYTHVADDPFGAGARMGGEAEEYLTLVLDEYLPRVVAAHALADAPVAMAGSSLGGLVSLFAALDPAFRGRLVAVGAMSPTLGWGAFDADGSEAIQNLHTERLPVGIYLDSGGGGTCQDLDADGIQEDSDDRDGFCVTSAYRDHLASLGYEFDTDLVHWHEPGAPHNEGAWAMRVPRMLAALDAFGF